MTAGRDSGAPATAGFASGGDGARWVYAGELSCANAGAALVAARSLPLPASGEIDLGAIGHADSAAVAVMLALRRRADAEGRAIRFVNVPPPLAALAQVYGVDAMLGG